MKRDVRFVMDRLGVGYKTVLHLINTRQIKAINVSRDPNAKRPCWRFTDAEIARFEAERTVGGVAPAPVRRRKKAAGAVIEFV
jgi:hypothetical protein